MAYDDTLPDNQNWVRFLTDDTSATPVNSDAEIDAVLSEVNVPGSAIKYAAAAICLQRILRKYLKKGGGLSEKVVGGLKLKYGGVAGAVESALRDEIRELKQEAARRSRSKPRRFQVVRHDKVSSVETGEISDRIT